MIGAFSFDSLVEALGYLQIVLGNQARLDETFANLLPH
jgi:hypothetical protein